MTVQTVATQKLKAWIEERDFGIEELVFKSQVCQQIIRAALKGEVPSSKAQKKISEAIGISREELFPSSVSQAA